VVRNEPDTGGSHLVDIDVIQPVFFRGRVVAWACSRAHQGDIGGPVPSGYNPYAEDLFAEGLVIPPVKLVEAGTSRNDIWEIILANVRLPDLVRGDIGAQLSAVRTAARRLEAIYAKYGDEVVDRAMRELLDRSERRARAQIAAIPDGRFSGSSWIEADGHGAPDAEIRCEVEVRGDRMVVSITSPPECRSYRNSYAGCTLGAVYYAVISALEPGIPVNEGLYRALDVQLGPVGTMLNAARPAACVMSTGDVWANVFDAVADALSKAVPDRAVAGWSKCCINGFSGRDPRTGDLYGGLMGITVQGGAGAVYGLDGGGLWGIIPTGGAAMCGDIELLEFRLPLHFWQHELRCDSGCPGRWRGAPGAVLEIEVVDHTSVVSNVGDGARFPSPSRLGGGAAADCRQRVYQRHVVRVDGSSDPFPLHSVRELRAGERLLSYIPGGGGIGSPLDRDRAAVEADIRGGYVSEEAARTEYGFVPLRAGGEMTPALSDRGHR
jgi:N-methylhydantoinase B